MAQFPEVVFMNFNYNGAGARQVAQFLGIDAVPMHRIGLILSKGYPERYEKRMWEEINRPYKGTDIHAPGNVIAPSMNFIKWFPAEKTLEFTGLWLDNHTASPPLAGCRYRLEAPLGPNLIFPPGPLETPEARGWPVLIERLRPQSAKAGRHTERKRFRAHPVAEAQAAWWGRMRSLWPWSRQIIDFEAEYDEHGKVQYVSIGIDQ